MRLQAANIPVSLDALLPANDDLLRKEVARALGVKPQAIAEVRLLKRSIDARKKANVHGVITAMVDIPSCADPASLEPRRGVSVKAHEPPAPLQVPDAAAAFAASGEPRPVVVGMGPAGLFCALYLARAGIPVTLLERGAPVDERQREVERFAAGGPDALLDPECNIQFGEGGAGTFSDGKLNTGIKSPHIRHVLETFVEHGAPADILVNAKPHIGTDRLPAVVASMRCELLERGCDVRFRTRFDGFDAENGRVRAALATNTATGEQLRIPTNRIILACGHSARDTYAALREAGLAMERKRFAVGVRIEHPQAYIDQLQYGAAAGHSALGAADYKLAAHVPDPSAPDGTRGVYTFCMCPGGQVVAAASELGGVCVNGASPHARDGRNANSALLVEVHPGDLPGEDVLAGVQLQRGMERAAYQLGAESGGAPYAAPAQTVGDFLQGAAGTASAFVEPTYPRGVTWEDLHRCLPPFVARGLEAGLPALDAKLRGFAHPEAVLTGVEARSSAPVRLVRGDDFQALAANDEVARLEGLYPAGEGAGYAGGIMSAAVDGLRVAESITADVMIAQAADRLRAGEPLIFPTDTVAGLGVAVLHAESPAALNRLKGRPEDQPIAWLIACPQDLDRFGANVPQYARDLAAREWPGGLTLIVVANDAVPPAFRTPQNTVALRLPASRVARALVKAAESPIAATSANLSGQPAPRTVAEASLALVSQVATLDLPEKASGFASAIIDCTGPAPRTLR